LFADADLSASADMSLCKPMKRPFILQGVSDLLRRVGYKVGTPPLKIPVNSAIIEEKSNEKEDHCMPDPLKIKDVVKGGSEDTVTITVTALLDPPPLFIKRHAQSTLSLPAGISYISNALSPFSPHATSDYVGTAVCSDRNDIRHQNMSCAYPSDEQNKSLVGTAGNAGYYSTHCRSSSVTPRVIKAMSANSVCYKGESGGDREKEKDSKDCLVYDKSARISFEAQFIAEVALACSLPVDNINIEEVHISQLLLLLS
jgi:hypothetical protein